MAWAVVLPVFVLLALTFSPTFSVLMATSAPVAVRTFMPAVKLIPPQDAASRSVCVSALASSGAGDAALRRRLPRPAPAAPAAPPDRAPAVTPPRAARER